MKRKTRSERGRKFEKLYFPLFLMKEKFNSINHLRSFDSAFQNKSEEEKKSGKKPKVSKISRDRSEKKKKESC
jgi:hypothetical protein